MWVHSVGCTGLLAFSTSTRSQTRTRMAQHAAEMQHTHRKVKNLHKSAQTVTTGRSNTLTGPHSDKRQQAKTPFSIMHAVPTKVPNARYAPKQIHTSRHHDNSKVASPAPVAPVAQTMPRNNLHANKSSPPERQSTKQHLCSWISPPPGSWLAPSRVASTAVHTRGNPLCLGCNHKPEAMRTNNPDTEIKQKCLGHDPQCPQVKTQSSST
jgi:hypothetical protein